MKSALLTRAALCVCPPAVVATTVASVPPVRHAVHRFTAAYEPKHNGKPAAAPCVPVDKTTFASRLPNDLGPVVLDEAPPAAFNALVPGPGPAPLNVGFPPGIGVVRPGGPSGGPSGVPEPAAWMTMVIGFGMIGAGMRQRQRYMIRSRKLALANGETVAAASGASLAGGIGAFSAVMLPTALNPAQAGTKLAQLGSKALNSSMLAKAAMCVCPPVAMAVSTAALPPVRHAVYNATAPKAPVVSPALLAIPKGIPCVPVEVPTAAETVAQQGETLAVLESTPNWPS